MSHPYAARARASALVCAALAAGCATNPATGKRQLSLVSEGQEIQMGADADRSIVASMGLDPDSARQQYVRALGMRLASVSERPNLPWTFRVIDDPVVNAFAIPGGHVYVTRGILAHLNNEAELVAVLGHEIGHVTARHSVTQMSRQQIAQLGLVVGMVAKPELQRYAGLASQGLGLFFLKYSRGDESQADELGFRYMRRTRYDTRQMPDVFTLLERVSQAGGSSDRLPEWLATHPNPANRREAVQRYITALPAESLGTLVNREPYLRRIDGMVFGDNPRDGFFRGTEFLQPELRFRITFPQGWRTQNQRQAVLAASPQQNALVQLSLVQQETPDAAARAFFSQQGVSGYAGRGSIHGFATAGGEFAATTDEGVLAGRATFIGYDGRVYRILAYASRANWPAYADAAETAAASFDRLTDPKVLGVQPWRVQLVSLTQGLTLEEFVQRYPGPAPATATALLNNVAAGARFSPGTFVKRIAGQPLP